MEWWQIALGAFVGSILARVFFSSMPDYSGRLKRLERKVDLLLQHFELTEPPPPDASEAVLAALQSGQKIQAIKLYRQAHPQVGLKEAKDIIDGLAAGIPSPLDQLSGRTLPRVSGGNEHE